MLNLSSNATDLSVVIAQVQAVCILISISLYNLTQCVKNKELWVSLLSSSVGYLLPAPILTKIYVSTVLLQSNASLGVFPQNRISGFKVHLRKCVNLKESWKCGLAEVQSQDLGTQCQILQSIMYQSCKRVD